MGSKAETNNGKDLYSAGMLRLAQYPPLNTGQKKDKSFSQRTIGEGYL